MVIRRPCLWGDDRERDVARKRLTSRDADIARRLKEDEKDPDQEQHQRANNRESATI